MISLFKVSIDGFGSVQSNRIPAIDSHSDEGNSVDYGVGALDEGGLVRVVALDEEVGLGKDLESHKLNIIKSYITTNIILTN